ncbi:MAG TPA: hypothetical protein VEX63_03735 [Flavisolibacter sp.]|nr:hypothetical protein [Flavisolibacter sp.]
MRSIGIIITFFLWLGASAQVDTMPVRDSNAIISDTLLQKDTAIVNDTVPAVQFIPVYRRFDTAPYIQHPYFKFD